jgi:hypothetical protein
MNESDWVFLIPVTAIIGGITVAVVGMLSKARLRELEVKERIAMIERGLVPPPEKDPQGFERAMNRIDRSREEDDDWDYSRPKSPRRYRSGGVTLIGVGLGLMLLIGVAGGSPQTGVGVGGFLVVLGIAFFVNSRLESRPEGSTRGPLPSRHSDSIPPH